MPSALYTWEMAKNQQFQLETFENGKVSVKDLRWGECMHSFIGPWEEANQIYLNQSNLEALLNECQEEKTEESVRPIVIYDIGLGIGSNALAVLHFLCTLSSKRQKFHRPVELISFENNLAGIEFALTNQTVFPFVSEYAEVILSLLERKAIEIPFSGSKLSWSLQFGDFLEHLEPLPTPDLIFYDLYSRKVCPEAWTLKRFQSLHAKTSLLKKSRLITYSSATSVRAALLLAGFHVGYGNATASKQETTIASNFHADLARPLDKTWLDKWQRSSKPLPIDVLRATLEHHPQFGGNQAKSFMRA